MTRTVYYSDEAATDLVQIWEHYAERASIRLADETVQKITATLSRVIAKHLFSGRLRPELGEGIRSFPVAPYVVFYRIERPSVQVLRILHGHRDVRQPLTSLLVAV